MEYMGRLRITTVLFFLLFFVSVCFAETWYVDNGTKEADATWSGVNGEAYVCPNGTGKGSSTLQYVIWGTNGSNGASSAGDTILLRGGTYREAWGSTSSSGAAMQIPTRLNGSSWTTGNYTTIASYPGEWAVIDGSTSGYYFAIGYGGLSWNSGANSLAYIKFERLGITGGSSGGIGVKGGPIWVRYCYIYENGKGSLGDGNRGGIHAMRLKESLIEYNYFYNNSGTVDHNKAHIIIYADYLYTSNTFDINSCNRDNEIRYNYFAGATDTGYKDKAAQYLADRASSPTGIITDMTNQTRGNKIHHNIGTGTSSFIDSEQDFAQIYNNISDHGHIGSADSMTAHPTYHRCTYNNTVIQHYISELIGDDRTEPNLDLAWFCANNIISEFGYVDYSPSIGIAVMWHASDCSYNYTWTNTLVDRNLIYKPGSSTRHFGLPNSYNCKSTRWITTSAFNTLRGVTNYTNNTSGLWSSVYVPNGSFVIGSSTIAEGGYNAAHPYLSGVSIPKYVGAVNPSDSDWVAGVLGLATDNNSDDVPDNLLLATGGSDPTWIEGETPESTPSAASCTIEGGGWK
jgi:hypothetical protein